MRLRILLVCCAALALTVGVATARAGNGEKNKCKNGGWQTVYRSDGTTFKNQDKCIEYLRSGGMLSPAPKICTNAGGTFSTDPTSNATGIPGRVLWTCNGLPFIPGNLVSECLQGGGQGFAVFGTASTCFKDPIGS